MALCLMACVGLPPPSFERTTSLQETPWVEVRLVGNDSVAATFEGCPERTFDLTACGEECGVRSHVYCDSPLNYQDTLRITSASLRITLDVARNAGCFVYGVPTNVTYRRVDVSPPRRDSPTIYSRDFHFVTITETFVR